MEFKMNDPPDDAGASARCHTYARCYAYVFPCAWEDHCKVGFSRDPFARISSLHPRWYEVFDLDRIVLIEADAVRDARDLELRLRRPLAEHRAPPPSTMRTEAGGVTEWLRGASMPLAAALDELRAEGHRMHAGRPWLVRALAARAEVFMEWALAQHAHHAQAGFSEGPAPGYVRDAMDAFPACGIDLAERCPPDFMAWYFGGTRRAR
jgi:hypothetical protein